MTDSIPEMFDSNNDSWDIIDSYFKENGLHQIIQHQLESFNDFVSSDIQDIISQNNPVVINYDYVSEVKHRYEINMNFGKYYLSIPLFMKIDTKQCIHHMPVKKLYLFVTHLC